MCFPTTHFAKNAQKTEIASRRQIEQSKEAAAMGCCCCSKGLAGWLNTEAANHQLSNRTASTGV